MDQLEKMVNDTVEKFGTVRLMQRCFPYMKNREASIMNIGSSRFWYFRENE